MTRGPITPIKRKLLQQWRIKMAMTQAAAAAAIGVSQQHWHKLETGQTSPRAATLNRISAAINIPIEKLMNVKIQTKNVPLTGDVETQKETNSQ